MVFSQGWAGGGQWLHSRMEVMYLNISLSHPHVSAKDWTAAHGIQNLNGSHVCKGRTAAFGFAQHIVTSLNLKSVIAFLFLCWVFFFFLISSPRSEILILIIPQLIPFTYRHDTDFKVRSFFYLLSQTTVAETADMFTYFATSRLLFFAVRKLVKRNSDQAHLS